jgi:acyl-CoA reductase-like NAD-dependent aldehyde dehydrogenase
MRQHYEHRKSRAGPADDPLNLHHDRSLSQDHCVRGTINVNGANAFGADAPFGGYRQSGIGREMGIEGFEEYLQTKTVAVPA